MTFESQIVHELEFDIIPTSGRADFDFLFIEYSDQLCGFSMNQVKRCNLSGGGPCDNQVGMRRAENDTQESAGCDSPNNGYVKSYILQPDKKYALAINQFQSRGGGFKLEFKNNFTPGGQQSDTISATICNGDYYVFEGDTLRTTSVTTKTRNSQSCIKQTTLNLMVQDIPSKLVERNICVGSTLRFLNQDFPPGTDTSFTQPNGGRCDTNYHVVVEAIPVSRSEAAIEICNGESYSVGNSSYTINGIYLDTLINPRTGCDSIVIINLSVVDSIHRSLVETRCHTDTVTINGQLIYQDTIIRVKVESQLSCDTIFEYHISFLPKRENLTPIDTSICFGSSFQLGQQSITQPGLYRDTIFNQAQQGCDSFLTYNVSFRPELKSTYKEYICAGDIFYDISGNEHQFNNDTQIIVVL